MTQLHQISSSLFVQSGSVAQFKNGINISGSLSSSGDIVATDFDGISTVSGVTLPTLNVGKANNDGTFQEWETSINTPIRITASGNFDTFCFIKNIDGTLPDGASPISSTTITETFTVGNAASAFIGVESDENGVGTDGSLPVPVDMRRSGLAQDNSHGILNEAGGSGRTITLSLAKSESVKVATGVYSNFEAINLYNTSTDNQLIPDEHLSLWDGDISNDIKGIDPNLDISTIRVTGIRLRGDFGNGSGLYRFSIGGVELGNHDVSGFGLVPQVNNVGYFTDARFSNGTPISYPIHVDLLSNQPERKFLQISYTQNTTISPKTTAEASNDHPNATNPGFGVGNFEENLFVQSGVDTSIFDNESETSNEQALRQHNGFSYEIQIDFEYDVAQQTSTKTFIVGNAASAFIGVASDENGIDTDGSLPVSVDLQASVLTNGNPTDLFNSHQGSFSLLGVAGIDANTDLSSLRVTAIRLRGDTGDNDPIGTITDDDDFIQNLVIGGTNFGRITSLEVNKTYFTNAVSIGGTFPVESSDEIPDIPQVNSFGDLPDAFVTVDNSNGEQIINVFYQMSPGIHPEVYEGISDTGGDNPGFGLGPIGGPNSMEIQLEFAYDVLVINGEVTNIGVPSTVTTTDSSNTTDSLNVWRTIEKGTSNGLDKRSFVTETFTSPGVYEYLILATNTGSKQTVVKGTTVTVT